jgi:flagellar hook-basal body complex protein FliE
MSDMMIGKAAAAYGQALTNGKTGGASESAGSQFADLLGGMIGAVSGTGGVSEQAALKAAAGKADITDVVTAVNNAELALETVVAVRDKVIGAYQEIMRMPV